MIFLKTQVYPTGYNYYYCHHDSEWHNLSWVLIYILEQFLPWMHVGSA